LAAALLNAITVGNASSASAVPDNQLMLSIAEADLVLLNCKGLVSLNATNYLLLRSRWDNMLTQSNDPFLRALELSSYQLYIEKNAFLSDSMVQQMVYCGDAMIKLKSWLGDKTPFVWQ
jgi:hypothetical protein